ncbi:MAG: DUF2889 domain-containing protein [Leptospirales bacterium]|nr:DUF2889 domain-containing protein [Leptospirales bacterium]
MSRLLKLAEDCAHRRSIEVATYSSGDDHIISHGRLSDIRLKDYYKFTGESVPSGMLHDMEIILLLKTPRLIIEDVEVLIKTVPREDCLLMEKILDPVIGLAITGGFSAKAREIAGGKMGCTHLVHLLITMAPAIVQGFWAYFFQKRPDMSKIKQGGASYYAAVLKDSCFTWREEGEAFQKLAAVINEKASE